MTNPKSEHEIGAANETKKSKTSIQSASLGRSSPDLDRRVWLESLLRYVFSRLRYEIAGLEHVPDSGPAIIIMNHTGWEEILLAILAVPRPLRIVGMRELMYL